MDAFFCGMHSKALFILEELDSHEEYELCTGSSRQVRVNELSIRKSVDTLLPVAWPYTSRVVSLRVQGRLHTYFRVVSLSSLPNVGPMATKRVVHVCGEWRASMRKVVKKRRQRKCSYDEFRTPPGSED